MPNPQELRVGDRVRFVSIQDEWADPKFMVLEGSLKFMNTLISCKQVRRVSKIEEDGYPWIEVGFRRDDGTIEHHSWGIYEAAGWKVV